VSDLYQYTARPPYGAKLNRRHPLLTGFLGFYAINEGGGIYATDLSGVLNLKAQGYSSNPWIRGVDTAIDALNSASFYGTVPTALQVSYPITMACGVRAISTPVNQLPFAGVYSTNSTTTRLVSIEGVNNTNITVYGGGSSNPLTVSGITLGTDQVCSAVADGSSITAYIGGVQKGTISASYSLTWTSTSTFALGWWPGIAARTGEAYIYWAAWWNRALTPGAHLYIGSSINAIWQLFTPPRAGQYRPAVGTAPLMRRTLYSRTGSRMVG
jgi:hypothetical protein